MIKYTPEQHEILDYISDNEGMLLVSAGAGAGKSFMAKQVAELVQPAKGLYTAFNKAIIEESVQRFEGLNVECKTLHSLAYKYAKPKNGKINEISYTCITEDISYNDKYKIITAINLFFVSASIDMYEFMDEHFLSTEIQLRDLSLNYIEQMISGELNSSFNFMLKYFHLLLADKKVKCFYDLAILDEINDVTAVALEIFKLIDAPKKLGLGETNQAIYDFLNLVNGFEELKDTPVLNLTQSFRCSREIAASIQNFMRNDVDKKFTFIGTDEPVKNNKTLYCTLTNAKIIDHINLRLHENKGFLLLRKLSDIFACPLAVISASQGKTPYQKKYKFLEKEYKNYIKAKNYKETYFDYLSLHVNDQEIKSAIILLLSLNRKGINLFNLYKKAKDSDVDPTYTIATVYTAKGLEFETVYIADDLNSKIRKIRSNGGIHTHEDLVAYRCYYVACSRCGSNLKNATALIN